MALKRVQVVDFDARRYSYAPPLIGGVVNVSEIESVREAEVRGIAQCVRLRMKSGDTLVCQGVPSDFLDETDDLATQLAEARATLLSVAQVLDMVQRGAPGVDAHVADVIAEVACALRQEE